MDEISVQGNCECGEKPLIELVVVVDGSDSYNNKGFSNLNVSIFHEIYLVSGQEEEAFRCTLDWVGTLIDDIKEHDRASIAVVQFSGNKQLAKAYKPGDMGKTTVSGIEHFRVEQPSTKLNNKRRLVYLVCFNLSGNN